MKPIEATAPKFYHKLAATGEYRTVASRFFLGHVPVDAAWAAIGEARQKYLVAHANRFRLGVAEIDSMPSPSEEEADMDALFSAILGNVQSAAVIPHESDTQLLTCLGAMFHNDLVGWDDSVFLNWYLAGPPRDFVIAGVGAVTLNPGDAVLFDPSRPHALLRKDYSRFTTVGWGDAIEDRSLFVAWDIDLTPQLEDLFDIERSNEKTLQANGFANIDDLQVMKATGAVRVPRTRHGS